MPLFYFHICDDDGAVPDLDGMMLPTEADALKEAEASAHDLLVQDREQGIPLDHRRIEVRNSGGNVIGVVKLKDLVH